MALVSPPPAVALLKNQVPVSSRPVKQASVIGAERPALSAAGADPFSEAAMPAAARKARPPLQSAENRPGAQHGGGGAAKPSAARKPKKRAVPEGGSQQSSRDAMRPRRDEQRERERAPAPAPQAQQRPQRPQRQQPPPRSAPGVAAAAAASTGNSEFAVYRDPSPRGGPSSSTRSSSRFSGAGSPVDYSEQNQQRAACGRSGSEQDQRADESGTAYARRIQQHSSSREERAAAAAAAPARPAAAAAAAPARPAAASKPRPAWKENVKHRQYTHTIPTTT